MSSPPPRTHPEHASALRLLRAAVAAVAAFALLGTAWMVHKAIYHGDVQTRRPAWFEGTFEVSYWLPLIATFLLGCLAVIAIYAAAARRLGRGEDIFANGFRERTRRELRERMKDEG